MAKQLNAGAATTKPRFNTWDALAKEIEPEKLQVLLHTAENIDWLASKDSGKSYPINLLALMYMETDPYAVITYFMKYSTGAAKRGTKGYFDALSVLRFKYSFPYEYEKSDSFLYRVVDRKSKMNNQSIDFGSFENYDNVAGYTTGIGGYPALTIFEEPIMNDNSETISDVEWLNAVKTIKDTIKRHYYSYLDRQSRGETKYNHPPFPYKIITLANDWDPDHYVSKRAQKFHPREVFINRALGFDYWALMTFWQNKINGIDIVDGIKEVIDEKWDDIVASVMVNHTVAKYVDRDEKGVKHDVLIVRSTKFANPLNRVEGSQKREDALDELYNALVTANSIELARVMGMGAKGDDDAEKMFSFSRFVPIDTDEKLKEEGRVIMGLSVAWDHDANRGPVGTPATKSGIRYVTGRGSDMRYAYRDLQYMVHPQVTIDGYGKGESGENTKLYHDMMVEASKILYDKYIGRFSRENGFRVDREAIEAIAIFDDDDGSYVYRMAERLGGNGYFDYVVPLENKNGEIASGGYSTAQRDRFIWQNPIDYGLVQIDKTNDMLVDWFRNVPKAYNMDGTPKHSTEGKWKKRYKDISDSAAYSLWPWRYELLWWHDEEQGDAVPKAQ